MSSEGAGAMNESNDEKSALVPRLRFSEFHEAGAWIAKSLKKVCEVNPANAELPEKFAYIDLESVEAGELKAHRIINRDEAPSRAQRLLRYGDVIFQIVRPYQRNNLHFKIDEEVPYVASTGYAQLRTSESEDFLFQAVHADDFIKRVIAKCTGSSYPAINSSDLADISLAIPSKAEQQKIADCLSSLDELITAETQKLDALKTHKKGLMQQLFPREGETVPRLRFPEFQEEREWEEVMLGEIAEIKLGKMLDSKKHTTGTLLPYLNNLAVRWNEVNTSNLPKMYFDKDELDRFGLMDGDVVVCEGGEPGRSAVWDGRLPDLKFQKAVHRVRFKVPFEPRLLVLFLESIAGTPRLESLFTGGGIKHLTQEVFARLKIPFTTHAEQQRISGCLASLDDLIIAQANKIDIFKTQKQGLMQQLFPVLDEVSA